jgi:hypothetical protein
MTYLAKAKSVRTQPQPPMRTQRMRDDGLASAQVAVEAAVTQPLDWPPPRPAWFAAWMQADDRRRAETMAAGKARLALRNNRIHGGNP